MDMKQNNGAKPAPRPPASPESHHRVEQVKQELSTKQEDRFKREVAEMKETEDLRQIDDDVEQAATLLEWYAEEHTHRPKSQNWFLILGAAAILIVGVMLFVGNIMSAITMVAFAVVIYMVAQRKPATVRYRVLVDGVAMNNLLYHYRDLAAFNVIYQPGETKTVILKSKRFFSPLLHLELGDTDPVAVRDLLLEFLPEDQDLEEPAVDVWSRRLGF